MSPLFFVCGLTFHPFFFSPTHHQNKDKTKSVAHPDRHRLLGGLGHLSEADRSRIINSKTVPEHHCCEDPYWLFKIYQDTEVNIKELQELITREMV